MSVSQRKFPSLAEASFVRDRSAGQKSRNGQRRKIAIVTIDIVGPVKNGGVGTAYTALSELLVAEGHDVTIIFANTFYGVVSDFGWWQKHYKAKGITLISLAEPRTLLQNTSPTRRNYAVYQMLKEMDFDIVHFSDLEGVGYFCQLAKRQGIAFQNTVFCVILHGPQAWGFHYNQQLVADLGKVQSFFYEKKSVEWADYLVSPSQFGVNWIADYGWKLPQNIFVEQYIMPDSTCRPYPGPRSGLNEIVFFGRLESRKGIELFCAAVDRLPESFLKGIKITFLGIRGLIRGVEGTPYLKKWTRKYPTNCQVIDDLNQEDALEYLRQSSALAVMPSKSETLGFVVMEALQLGVPFIASRIPAFEELISPEYHHQLLFDLDPDSLARKIQAVLGSEEPQPQATMRIPPESTKKNWADWHAHLPLPSKTGKQRKTRVEKKPLVSLCLVHQDRSNDLGLSVRHAREQSYPEIEVIQKVFNPESSPSRDLCWNSAVEQAKGEYVILMDEDVVARENLASVLMEVALKTGADIVTCGFDRFKGRSPASMPIDEPIYRIIGTGNDLGQSILMNSFGDRTALYRKKIFQALGGLATDVEGQSNDWALFQKAVLNGYHLESCPEALFWKRSPADAPSDGSRYYEGLLPRLRNFSDIRGHDLRPFLSLVQAMSIHSELGDPLCQIPSPLIDPERTDYFSNPGGMSLLARLDSRFLRGKKATLSWKAKTVTVNFESRESELHVVFDDENAKGLKFFDLTLASLTNTKATLNYVRPDGRPGNPVTTNLRLGRTRWKFSLNNIDLTKPLRLSIGGKITKIGVLDLNVYALNNESRT